jgi:hypothetical protein
MPWRAKKSTARERKAIAVLALVWEHLGEGEATVVVDGDVQCSQPIVPRLPPARRCALAGSGPAGGRRLVCRLLLRSGPAS